MGLQANGVLAAGFVETASPGKYLRNLSENFLNRLDRILTAGNPEEGHKPASDRDAQDVAARTFILAGLQLPPDASAADILKGMEKHALKTFTPEMIERNVRLDTYEQARTLVGKHISGISSEEARDLAAGVAMYAQIEGFTLEKIIDSSSAPKQGKPSNVLQV